MSRFSSLFLFGFIGFFLNCITQTEGGECCRAHYDRLSGLHYDTTWCTHYCCHSNQRLYCCNNILRRAPYLDRLDFCTSWFTSSANLWAPILIAVVVIALLIGLGICCCCCIPGFFCC